MRNNSTTRRLALASLLADAVRDLLEVAETDPTSPEAEFARKHVRHALECWAQFGTPAAVLRCRSGFRRGLPD